MAKVYGKPSKYINRGVRRNGLWYMFFWAIFTIGLVLCFKLAGDIFGPNNPNMRWILLVPYLLIILLLYKAFEYIFKIDFFLRGRSGEELIAEELAKLPESYAVFRNIHINQRKSDIDFIVIGPKGILTVEAKSHSGQITFDGRMLLKYGRPFEKDFLMQARKEAVTLADYLKTYGFQGYIRPVIVFSSHRASMNFGLRPVDNIVYVVGRAWLLKLIYSLPDAGTGRIPQTILEQILTKLSEQN